jgi:hypothetical protein
LNQTLEERKLLKEKVKLKMKEFKNVLEGRVPGANPITEESELMERATPPEKLRKVTEKENSQEDQDSQAEEEKNNLVFDTMYNFNEEYEDYKRIKYEFKSNKIKFEKKRLKNAIIYDNHLLPE